MPRSLRSGSRRKKLQVQRIQQVNKTLRVSINNCIAANIDNFNQIEFLSLFGLTQIGMKNGQKTKCDGHIKRTQKIQNTDENDGTAFSMGSASHTTISPHDFNEAFKHRYELGKCPKHTHMLHAIFGRCLHLNCFACFGFFFAILQNRM